MYSVIIIGAGLSGVMAARTLMESGVQKILLVEKSKSVGGRLATRRLEKGRVDHGAQFFTVRTEDLQSEVNEWLSHGWVREWYRDPYPKFIAPEGMNSLIKRLSKSLPVKLRSKVTEVKKLDSYVEVLTEDGKRFQGEKLIVTAPLPQTIDLVQEIGQVDKLLEIPYNACYVGIIRCAESKAIGANGHVTNYLPEGMERVVNQLQKGITDEAIYAIYMTGSWSNQHWKLSDNVVKEKMMDSMATILDPSVINEFQLKRWRYAESSKVIRDPYVEICCQPSVVVCGEVFLRQDDTASRTRFESAFISGIEAGRYVGNRHLER
ncbi:NAD(P)/FAD-dependent oxidoreductase [Bacillus coahuilensis]|uniref:NAD(P)/FAD-dependent oxidoreductase n=1 Tax=Bacillus coahuilensis TaxID=408580 RepID=UPI0001850A9E|nr:FAD-dependent oxidoreductase [Bacillus coahuilensis]